MKKKPSIDAAYYDNHCFAEELAEAKKNGTLGKTRPGETALEAIKRYTEENKKKPLSMRLPVYVIKGVKAQAKKAGVPYTTYICAVLERALAEPRRA
jgi:predicted DNA binding CopG/RHH family protein